MKTSTQFNIFKRTTKRAGQKGNALAFTLLALVVGSILIGVGVRQYSQSERSASMQEVAAEVVTVIGEAKAAFGQYAYVGMTTAQAVGGGTIPRFRSTSTTTAANKFSGAITLADNNAVTQGTGILTYALIPQDQCQSIVIGSESLARQVRVAGVDVKALDGAMNIATLNTQCISSPAVSVAWVIGRT